MLCYIVIYYYVMLYCSILCYVILYYILLYYIFSYYMRYIYVCVHISNSSKKDCKQLEQVGWYCHSGIVAEIRPRIPENTAGEVSQGTPGHRLHGSKVLPFLALTILTIIS